MNLKAFKGAAFVPMTPCLFQICLHAVGLLDDANRTYFHISSISVGPKKTQKYQNLETHCQEWMNQDTASKGQGEYVYRVKVGSSSQ